MKTLVVYATKHGATAEIAKKLAAVFGGADLCDLGKSVPPDLAEYGCVVLGSPLYAGMARKALKAYAAANEAALCEKRLGLFFSGLAPSDTGDYFKNNFPAKLVAEAEATAMLGAIFDPARNGFFSRFIVKMVAKTNGYVNTVNEDAIKKFAVELGA